MVFTMNKEFYRPDEIAKIMNVSKATVYRLINQIDDPLPAKKFKGFLRIKASEFDEWIERHHYDTYK